MWLVIDIGCLECRNESYVVGIFSNKEKAEQVALKINGNDIESLYEPEFSEGQIRVFELSDIDCINERYIEYIK